MTHRILLIITTMMLAAAATLPAAQFVSPGFSETRVATGLDPTSMAIAPDGRIFIAEKAGRIRIVKNGQLLATPFATVPAHNDNEAGLDGICLHPDFASNGWVYVYYTSNRMRNRVGRFTANGDRAEGGETLIMDLEKWSGAHNGGSLNFGPDGKLYIGTGDLYDYSSTPSLPQRLDSLWGKLLRLNADGSIPTDNPFYGQTSGKNRAIWARGFRNPFTARFQPGTGRLYVSDVGAQYQEEICYVQPGQNHGWPVVEGYHDSRNNASSIDTSGYTEPILALDHNMSIGVAAITASMFMPSTSGFPSEFAGKFFFADYQYGWVRYIDTTASRPRDTVKLFATGISQPLYMEVSKADGSLYYLSRGGDQHNTSSSNGSLWKVTYTGSDVPTISVQPGDVTVGLGQDATFRVSASGSDLRYQWRRNGSTITGATGASYTLGNAQAANDGEVYSVVVSNGAGAVTSAGARLTVTSNRPPVATISLPGTDSTYRGGGTLAFAGSASDPEDGALGAARLTWKIDFHHNTHYHPALPATTGIDSGSYAIPATGETSANVWYRVWLTATDNAGLSHTVYRDIQPQKATFTLATQPPGLQLSLDGTPLAGPVEVTGVVGVNRMVAALPSQTLDGTAYTFSHWSDGGAANRTITTPTNATTYTAVYTAAGGSGDDGDHGMTPGSITREVWREVAGETFDGVTLEYAPTEVGTLNQLASPVDEGDTYVSRIRGYLLPPSTGSYRFWISGDNACELWLSSSTDPSNKQRIAWVESWTYPQEWDRHASQASAAVSLSAGEAYYIEVLHKEGGGGDHVAVGWLPAGQSGQGPSQIVPGSALAPFGASEPGDGGGTLPNGYEQDDVGDASPAGSASYANGRWTVRGAGAEIWNRSDGFHYVSRHMAGDGSITVRVISQTRTDPWAKAGIMIRDSHEAGSRHAMIAVTPDHGTAFQRRTATGGTSRHTSGSHQDAPAWLRLVRTGDLIEGFESSDGVDWRRVGSARMALPTTVHIGLCVSSHRANTLSQAVFEEVDVSAGPLGDG